MKRRFVMCAALAISFVAATPASAAEPVSAEIVTSVDGTFSSDIEGCTAGTWSDELKKLPPPGNLDKLILNPFVTKTLLCDGSHDFMVIELHPKVRGMPFPQSGPWHVTDGVIDGERVIGHGWMVLDGPPPVETFTGSIHTK